MHKKIIMLFTLILAVLFAVPAWADENSKISLEDAIKMAISNSKDLKAAEKNIDSTEIQFEDAMADVKYMPLGSGYGASDKSTFLSYFNTESALKVSKKKLKNDEAQLAIDTKTAYYSCLTTQIQKEMQEKTLELDKLKLVQEKARFNVGMSTKSKLDSLESQIATDKASLEEVNKSLDKAYSELNTLIGKETASRPVLTTDIDTDIKVNTDVDREVSAALYGSFELWSANESAKLASQLKIFETWHDVGENKEEKAYLEAASTQDTIKLQLRELVNSLNYMAEKYNQLTTQKQEIDEVGRVAKLNYDLGLTTKDALLEVDVKRMSLDYGIASLKSQYVVAQDTLAKYKGTFKYEI